MHNHLLSRLATLAFATLGVACIASAQDGLNPWVRQAMQLDAKASPNLNWLSSYESFAVDYASLKGQLALAPMEGPRSMGTFSIISLPVPEGGIQRFKVQESPIMTEALAKQIPVKTYRVVGVDDPSAHGRLDIGPNGFHSFVRRDLGTYMIDPMTLGDQKRYVVFTRAANLEPRNFACFTQSAATFPGLGNGAFGIQGAGDNRKTYRLAMNATGEYTAFYGGTAPAAQAGVVTSVNRVNAVYEIDMAIRLTIVSNTCYTNSATDPYTNNNGSTMLGQNQTNTDTNVGNANYDIGHVFSTGGGGIAGLGVVGFAGNKARGVTGSPSPIGDGFDIDYVAHEMGHQFGGNHTFNGTTGSCGGGNRSSGAAYEVGSGSTIMAYAGICGAEDLQPHSDAYMHYKSIEETVNFRNFTIPGVGTTTATANLTPTVNAGADFTIPQSTPYKLTATGSDPNGDTLTYCWEQYDLGAASPPTSMASGPIVRSLNPTTNAKRFVPPYASVLSGAATPWELLANVNRTMVWRCTVRDNFAGSGGYATDTAVITVNGAAFAVTSPNTAVSYPGLSSQTVTWTVGGGSVAPNVNIYLSTNGGASYETGTATLLLANTPNDGTQAVTIPNVPGASNRIIVEGAGNIFYDVSNANFTITAPVNNPVPAVTSMSPSSATAGGSGFTLTVNGSNFVNGSVVNWNGSPRTTTFVNSGQVTAAITSADIATVGTRSVTVFNPAPGGGTSGALTFTVNPIEVNPTSFTLTGGVFVSGTLASLVTSDDNRYVYSNAVPLGDVSLEVTGSPGGSTASQIVVSVESQAANTNHNQQTFAWNFTNSTWDLLGAGLNTTTDTVRTYTITTSPSQYLSGGQVRIKITHQPISRSARSTEMRIDRVHWTINP